MTLTFAPMMLAVMCLDIVSSMGNVVSVKVIGENVVSVVVDRNFLPWKMHSDRLVMLNQESILMLCCGPQTVSSTTPVVSAMVYVVFSRKVPSCRMLWPSISN